MWLKFFDDQGCGMEVCVSLIECNDLNSSLHAKSKRITSNPQICSTVLISCDEITVTPDLTPMFVHNKPHKG